MKIVSLDRLIILNISKVKETACLLVVGQMRIYRGRK